MIETERLILRPLRIGDAPDLLEYQSNAEVVRYTPWPIRDSEAVTAALETTISNHHGRLTANGDSIFLAWEHKETGKVIGQSNMTLRSREEGLADIGWALHQSFQRQGYAHEASVALLRFAFIEYQLERVIAKIDVRNLESVRLAEKLGMHLAGQVAETQLTKGELCELWTYAVSNTGTNR